MSKFMEEVFHDDDKHELFKKIFGNNNQMAATASQVLKREFLSNSKLFTNKAAGLKPIAGDVVAVLKEEPRLGLIVEVVIDHRVVVRHKHRVDLPSENSGFSFQTSFILFLRVNPGRSEPRDEPLVGEILD